MLPGGHEERLANCTDQTEKQRRLQKYISPTVSFRTKEGRVRDGEHIVGADSTLHSPAFLPLGPIFAESFQDTRHTYLTVLDYRLQQQLGSAPNQDIAPLFEWSYAQAET
jgi:hypothetical protein